MEWDEPKREFMIKTAAKKDPQMIDLNQIAHVLIDITFNRRRRN